MANPKGPQVKQVSQRAIKLLFKIWAGYNPVADITYYLEYISLHLPEERLEPALEWLIKNELTGKRFAQFVEFECGRSALELIKQVTKGIERTKGLRTIMASDLRLS